jgi:hypothetical protein
MGELHVFQNPGCILVKEAIEKYVKIEVLAGNDCSCRL